MASVNKVTLIGNLGKDPETKATPGDKTICTFSIATTEKWTSNGKKQERTDWHNIEAWGKVADICSQYLRKGSSVFIDGKIQYDSWEKDGVKKFRTKIVANSIQLLGKRESNEINEPSLPPEPSTDDLPF